MGIHRIIIVVLTFSLLLSFLAGCGTEATISEKVSWYQQIVDAVKAAPLIENSPQYDGRDYSPELPADKWNINEYFKILTHLSMKEGYVLDWVYIFNSNGGYPVIYTRPVDQAPFKNYEEWGEAYEAKTLIGGKIGVEDNEKGYFEYIVFNRIGGRFYIFWHSALDNWEIICDKAVLDTWNHNSFHDNDLIKKAKSLNFQPVIELQEKTAKVSIVTFNSWNGFRRETYVIDRQYPHNIIDTKYETILEYHANVTF